MNSTVYEFYQKNQDLKKKFFYESILLDDEALLNWNSVKKMVPNMPKGWFELCRLPVGDRIDFIWNYWNKILPYFPHTRKFLDEFFSKTEDVAIFITKKHEKSAYIAELIYSMDNETTFFRGGIPASEEKIAFLQHQFNNLLPKDYLSFFKIHNGFCKHFDTGLVTLENLKSFTERMQKLLLEHDRDITCGQKIVDPMNLIFFYQDFGQSSFQCFYEEWYPSGEMGNVYFSLSDYAISDYSSFEPMDEKLAFPSFMDWLIFYLEEMEI